MKHTAAMISLAALFVAALTVSQLISDANAWTYYSYYPHYYTYRSYYYPRYYYPFYGYSYYSYYYYPYNYRSPCISYSATTCSGPSISQSYAVTVSSSPSGISGITGGGTYTSGQTVTLSAPHVVDGGSNVRYVFSNWSGDYSGSTQTIQGKVDGTKAAVANYKTQYLLTVTSNLPNIPGLPKAGWYNSGDVVSYSLQQTIQIDEGTRLVLVGATLDGASTSANSLTTDSAHTLSVNYKKQYLLQVKTPVGSTQGQGWYDEGSTANVNVDPTSEGLGVRKVFDHWLGDQQSRSPSTTFEVKRPQTLTAIWKEDYSQLLLPLALIVIAVTGAAMVLGRAMHKEAKAQPHMAGLVPTKYCKECGVGLPRGTKFCSECGTGQT